MRSCFTFFCLISCFFNLNAQIVFEKAYIIDNNGEKKEGFIKNIDWYNNPKKIEFKINESAESQTLTIQNIKEFGIYNFSKYVRFEVKVDTSSKFLNDLSRQRNPEFKNDTVFLKVLIEGKANLYEYQNKDLLRFFFGLEGKNGVEQLVYKKYYISESTFRENQDFKTQLWNNLKCDKIVPQEVENLECVKRDLIRFFKKYIECNSAVITTYGTKDKKKLFNLRIKSGLSYTDYFIANTLSNFEADFDPKFAFRLGLEAEFILPFNKNKWSIFVEPTYQSVKNEKQVSTTQYATINYSSIELPVGLRYYMFLNNNTKLFINAVPLFDFPLNSNIIASQSTLEVDRNFSFAGGAGMIFKRLSFEARYTRREVLTNYRFWYSKYSGIAFILGWKIN